MSDVIRRGVIEIVADARQLRAGIDDAKRSIRTLGEGQKDISKSAAASIDQYIGRLEMQRQTVGKTVRETELYKLALRGASNEQLAAANASLKLSEAYQRGVVMGDQIKTGLLTIGTVAAVGLIAAAASFDALIKKAGDFQDMAEKTGDSAENIASLAVAAATAGVEMDTVVSASAKLTKALTGVDDESKAAGAAIAAIGLDIGAFKQLAPADQFETVAKALDGFQDGAQKTAVAMALFGKSGAELLPFVKELAGETGRQNILTEEQIRLSDEYADKQAKLKAQIGLYAQAIAAEMLPAFNDLIAASAEVIKDLSGIDKSANDLSSNTAIQDFAESAVDALAFVVDAADGVSRSFEYVGKTIGAMAAYNNLPIWKIGEKIDILKSLGEDQQAILMRPMFSDKVKKQRTKRKEIEKLGPEYIDSWRNRKVIDFDGAVPKAKKSGGGSANQEAKAQLASDLSEIKKSYEAITNTYSNAEKIMEAKRSAGLIDEKEYYASKLGFLTLNSSEQESALQQEIARMQAESLAGKDRIDNDKKIAEKEAEILKIRENASASAQILSIQEVAANEKIAKSYIDATIAAEAYIQTIIDRNAREIEGVGRGNKFREIQSGKNQIEDKFTGQRQVLERDLRNNQINQKQFDDYLAVAKDTYSKEVALYDERTAAIDAKNADWVNGMDEAYANYMDEAANASQRTADLFTEAYQSIEQAMADFLFDPFENGVDGMLKSFGETIKKMVAQAVAADLSQRLFGALGNSQSGGIFSMIAGLFGGGGADTSGIGTAMSLMNDIPGRAIGGPVSAGGLYQVNEKGTPELLNVAGKQYLMMGNQSGTVDPKTESSGGGASPVSIVVHVNGNSSAPDVRRAAGQGAREALNALSGAQRYR